MGGHFNHEFFWQSMAPLKEEEHHRVGNLMQTLINNSFETVEKLQTKFNEVASTIEGSGWCWLVINSDTYDLEIRTTNNQDTLFGWDKSIHPILTVDIWEHAYYVNYQNRRAAFVDDIWKIINWKRVSHRFEALNKK